MATPESPLDKKDLKIDAELSLDQRVARLEHTLENAFNYLAQGISETELKNSNDAKELQAQLSKTLTLMNMSTLQNLISIRELLRVLIDKEIVEPKTFEAQVTAQLTTAIEAQQKAILAEQALQAEVEVDSAPAESGATA